MSEEKDSCKWIDPTIKKGRYVTDSIVASIMIACACVLYNDPFNSLVTAWWRMLSTVKKKLPKNLKIKEKVTKIAQIISHQGQCYKYKSNNFIHDLFLHGKSDCLGNTLMLYAILEVLEPNILNNVYILDVPKHILLVLYDKEQQNWIEFETTDFDTFRNVHVHIKRYHNLNAIIFNQLKEYNKNKPTDIKFSCFFSTNPMIPLLSYLNTIISYNIIDKSSGKIKVRNPEKHCKKLFRLFSLLRNVTFCHKGPYEKIFCTYIKELAKKEHQNLFDVNKSLYSLWKYSIIQELENFPEQKTLLKNIEYFKEGINYATNFMFDYMFICDKGMDIYIKHLLNMKDNPEIRIIYEPTIIDIEKWFLEFLSHKKSKNTLLGRIKKYLN